MTRAWLLAPLLAACTGDAAIDGVSCELRKALPSRSPELEVEVVVVISDSASMIPYEPALAAQLQSLASALPTARFGLRIVVPGGPGQCTSDGDPNVLDLSVPWFRCDPTGDCRYQNFDGAFADALSCALAVPSTGTGPSPLLARLDAALADPALQVSDTALFVVLISPDDDASPESPEAYAARVLATRPLSKLIVAVIGGNDAPRLDAFRAAFEPREIFEPIDGDRWAEIFAIGPVDRFVNPCLPGYAPGTPVVATDVDGSPVPPCVMASPDRPLATTPLPCVDIRLDEAQCGSDDPWSGYVERARFDESFADMRYACAP